MKLEDIGFYTLSDERARDSSNVSQMQRCEILLTDVCNFKCPYCRGNNEGVMDIETVKFIIDQWNTKNIRFSGGEPTLYTHIREAVSYAKDNGVERIALSSNGSAPLELYKELIELGVNDFSISLDACCSSFGKQMCGGIPGMWEKVVSNIKEIAKLTYVTLGMVFTPETIDTAVDVITFGSELGVADIRIISSAQSNEFISNLELLPKDILEKHPILKYRVNNYLNSRNVRGIKKKDNNRCQLMLDDSMISGDCHYPCVIHMREGGQPIGKISDHMREERVAYANTHDTFNDPICRGNCLDICIDYNNKWRELHDKGNEQQGV